MTFDEIIRSPLGREQLVALAREAGFEVNYYKSLESEEVVSFDPIITYNLERFAALVAAHEREKQAEQEHFMCEPVPPISEEGWTDWVCPKPKGYLMQCCDCGLIHEVDSRVAKYDPMPSEEFTVVEDQNMQCQWRVRRRDDLATTQPVQQEPVAWALSHSMGLEFGSKYPIQETKEAAEQMARQHMGAVVVTPLYTAPQPVKEVELTDDEIAVIPNFDGFPLGKQKRISFARAVIAADRAKNNLCERTK